MASAGPPGTRRRRLPSSAIDISSQARSAAKTSAPARLVARPRGCSGKTQHRSSATDAAHISSSRGENAQSREAALSLARSRYMGRGWACEHTQMSRRRAARLTTAAYGAGGEVSSISAISRSVRIIDGRLRALVGGHAAPPGDSETKTYYELLYLRDFVTCLRQHRLARKGRDARCRRYRRTHSFKLLHPLLHQVISTLV